MSLWNVKIAVVIIIIFICGCAETQLLELQEKYQSTLNSMLNKAGKEDFVRMWGLPTDKQIIGRSEFWVYRISYGMRGGGQSFYNPFAPSFIGPTVRTRTWEAYDEITLEFDSYDFLKSWRLLLRR